MGHKTESLSFMASGQKQIVGGFPMTYLAANPNTIKGGERAQFVTNWECDEGCESHGTFQFWADYTQFYPFDPDSPTDGT